MPDYYCKNISHASSSWHNFRIPYLHFKQPALQPHPVYASPFLHLFIIIQRISPNKEEILMTKKWLQFSKSEVQYCYWNSKDAQHVSFIAFFVFIYDSIQSNNKQFTRIFWLPRTEKYHNDHSLLFFFFLYISQNGLKIMLGFEFVV